MGMKEGGKIFRGDVRLNVELDDGSHSGYLPAQNATQFQIQVPEAETTDRTSRMRDTAGQVLDSVSEPQPHELSITFDGFNGQLLASAFNGALEHFTASAKTGETVQITARVGAGVQVGSYQISEVTVSEDDGGSPGAELVEGTDYEVEERLGMIRALEGGSVEDGDTLHVTFDAEEVTGDMIRGAARSEIRGELVFDGLDTVTGQSVVIEIDRVILSGSGEFDFLSEEFATVDVGGRMVTLPGELEPYRIRFLD